MSDPSAGLSDALTSVPAQAADYLLLLASVLLPIGLFAVSRRGPAAPSRAAVRLFAAFALLGGLTQLTAGSGHPALVAARVVTAGAAVAAAAALLRAVARGPDPGPPESPRRAEPSVAAGADEARLRAVIENGFDAVALLDADGTVQGLTAAAAWLAGSRPAEMVGRTVFDLVHPDDRAGVRGQFADQLRHPGSVATGTYRIRQATGGWRWVEARRTNLLADPAVGAVVLALRDVTGWKAAEDALRRAAGALEDLPAAFFTVDRDWRFTYVNPEAERHMRRPRAEVLRQALWAVFPDILGTSFEREYRQAFATGRPTGFEAHYPPFDRWYEVRAYPSADGLGIYFHDVTERKKLEEQLRQAQKMEAVGRLAGGIAHDFNNLLTVINGSGHLALAELAADDPARGPVEEVVRAADRAAALTRRLMAFGRKQVYAPRPLDLNAVVRDMASLLRRVIGGRVELEMRLAPDLWPVSGDPVQLEQVLLNLAVNARDAMPRGGRLIVETRNATDDPAGPAVVLTVSDTGVGMTDAVRAKLFEPFFTTKPVGEGTGLGLAIVYGVVQEHGGRVDVRSAPGAGATFRVALPRGAAAPAGPAAPPASPAEPTPPPVGRPVVLLAEDEDTVRRLNEHVLRAAGFEVLACGSGEDALAVSRSHPGRVDLLVTDVVMPGMCGRELAEAVAGERPGTPVLFVSGHTEDAVLRNGVRAGEAAILEKPFTPTVFANKVREVLARPPLNPPPGPWAGRRAVAEAG